MSFLVLSVQQRSLEDEISRTTAEDIPIFMISYAVIFLYIAVALGEFTSWKRILVVVIVVIIIIISIIIIIINIIVMIISSSSSSRSHSSNSSIIRSNCSVQM